MVDRWVTATVSGPSGVPSTAARQTRLSSKRGEPAAEGPAEQVPAAAQPQPGAAQGQHVPGADREAAEQGDAEPAAGSRCAGPARAGRRRSRRGRRRSGGRAGRARRRAARPGPPGPSGPGSGRPLGAGRRRRPPPRSPPAAAARVSALAGWPLRGEPTAGRPCWRLRVSRRSGVTRPRRLGPLAVGPLLEGQRDGVHAVAVAGGRLRGVVEDVPEVRAAPGAPDLGAHHAEAAVLEELDGVARPSGRRSWASRSGTRTSWWSGTARRHRRGSGRRPPGARPAAHRCRGARCPPRAARGTRTG